MKKIAYASCFGVIGILTTEFGVIGIMPQIASYYHITIDKAGLLLSAFAFVVAIAGPFMSLLSSRFDRRKVMLASLSLFLITGIVSAFSPPFWLLVSIRILPAMLHSVYYAAAIAAVIKVSEKKDHHKMMAIALSGISIATVSTIPLATYLASIFTWQYSFVLQAAVSALALISIYTVMPAMPVEGTVTYGKQLLILKKPMVWLSLTMSLLMFSAEFSIYSYFADYLVQVKSMSPKGISYLMLLFGITGLLGTWIAGKALSKNITFTNIAFLAGCNIIVPLALYFTGYSTLSTAAIVALWGILYAPGFLIATASISSAAPEALEFANGMAASFANFGITAGTMAGGWVIVHHSIAQVPWVAVIFGIAAIIFVLARHFSKNSTQIITK
ncbi:MFS transporter [Pedobacter antarcticus]|uniref:MFS transporter n=1 Tax=Pedobacter antarcticus TaxID=34086 RepID=UPI00293058EB|nr:MFS transporter [Pedobacter antarcticus]